METHSIPRVKWRPRSLRDCYKLGRQIGEGTYGQVYEAHSVHSEMSLLPPNQRVAVKRMFCKDENEGFPITSLREIKLLQKYAEKNIIKLLDVCTDVDWKKPVLERPVCFVFEYCDHDLTGLREMGRHRDDRLLPMAQVKHYLHQLITGVAKLHKGGVIHRDIKGANILVTTAHEIKLADFGLARPVSAHPLYLNDSAPNSLKRPLTNPVVTLWYRAPELLAGDKNYGTAIDMWSIGCLMAELITGHALFPGETELEQIERIFKVCGTPTVETWPGFSEISQASSVSMKTIYPNMLRDKFDPLRDKSDKGENARITPLGVDLLEKLLCLDPTRRISAKDAATHDFFYKEEPKMPLAPGSLPPLPSQGCYEFIAKKHLSTRNLQQAPVVVPNQIPAHNFTQRPPYSNFSKTYTRPAVYQKPTAINSVGAPVEANNVASTVVPEVKPSDSRDTNRSQTFQKNNESFRSNKINPTGQYSSRRDEPRRDELQHDEPRRDEPRRDEPRRDEARRDDSRRDDSRRDEPRRNEPRRDETLRNEPRRDEPRRDEFRRDETRRDETRRDDSRRDEPRRDEPRRDETRRDDSRCDDSRRDESRRNEPRRDESRRDEAVSSRGDSRVYNGSYPSKDKKPHDDENGNGYSKSDSKNENESSKYVEKSRHESTSNHQNGYHSNGYREEAKNYHPSNDRNNYSKNRIDQFRDRCDRDEKYDRRNSIGGSNYDGHSNGKPFRNELSERRKSIDADRDSKVAQHLDRKDTGTTNYRQVPSSGYGRQLQRNNTRNFSNLSSDNPMKRKEPEIAYGNISAPDSPINKKTCIIPVSEIKN